MKNITRVQKSHIYRKNIELQQLKKDVETQIRHIVGQLVNQAKHKLPYTLLIAKSTQVTGTSKDATLLKVLR